MNPDWWPYRVFPGVEAKVEISSRVKEGGQMPGYGFRLYEVKLVAGFGKSKAVPFDQCGSNKSQHVGAWVRRLLTTLEGYEALSKMPQQRHAVDEPLKEIAEYQQLGDRDDPQIHFVSHTKAPTTRIRFEFSYGRIGRVPFALGPTQEQYIDLRKRATGHTYRGLFYLPADGVTGVLALETIPSSAHPIESLNAWLARAAVDVAAEDADARDQLPEEQRDAVEPLPYKLNFKQIVNYERLSKMIKESAKAELVLRRTVIGQSGRKRAEKIRMVTQIETQAERHQAVQVAQRLYNKAVGGEVDDAAGMAELEGLAPGDVSGLEFNDGYLKLDDGSGPPKKIGLETVDKYFDYPVGSSVPLPSTTWEQRVAAEVVSLQGLLGVELDIS